MIAALFLAATVNASVSCPMTLPREAVTVRGPAGWSGYVPPEFVRLTGFGLLAGPPNTLSYLAPIKSTKDVITWRVGEGPRWLFCTYDGSAAIQIARPLPPTGATCTITYRETKQEGITAMAASCR